MEQSKKAPAKKSAKKEAVPAEPEPAPVTKPAPVKKQTPADIAAEKYTINGWNVIKPPKGSVNDFLASRNGRLHFVQVVTKDTIADQKYHGSAKNDFVQNAFSNGAIPIFAHVVGDSKVTFEDVNSGNRVIINARVKKTEEVKQNKQ